MVLTASDSDSSRMPTAECRLADLVQRVNARMWEAGAVCLLLVAFVCFVAPAPFLEVAFEGDTSTAMLLFRWSDSA